jgi:predicted phosphoadenosine phosphosulfate sulfurtransferase
MSSPSAMPACLTLPIAWSTTTCKTLANNQLKALRHTCEPWNNCGNFGPFMHKHTKVESPKTCSWTSENPRNFGPSMWKHTKVVYLLHEQFTFHSSYTSSLFSLTFSPSNNAGNVVNWKLCVSSTHIQKWRQMCSSLLQFDYICTRPCL